MAALAEGLREAVGVRETVGQKVGEGVGVAPAPPWSMEGVLGGDGEARGDPVAPTQPMGGEGEGERERALLALVLSETVVEGVPEWEEERGGDSVAVRERKGGEGEAECEGVRLGVKEAEGEAVLE
jgi:hypothetical protein